MLTVAKKKETKVPIILRRMRESSGLTMREAGAMVGISHVAISQFENEKLHLPDYRIEQLVKVYGYTMDEYYKIIGKAPVISPKDDCLAIIDRMSDEQLAAVCSVLKLIVQPNPTVVATNPFKKIEKNSKQVEVSHV